MTRKLQIPSSKLQRSLKLQTSKLSRGLRCLGLVFGIWCFIGSWSLVLGASDEVGFGPRISVPRDLPQTTSRKLPKPNLIDQTHEDAMYKSRGCMECHKGLENPSMHVSQNVVLGCIDCHGGNPTPGLTQRKAHILPLHPEFWPTSANPADADVLMNQES